MEIYGIEFEEFSRNSRLLATNIDQIVSRELFEFANKQINPLSEHLFMGCHPSDIYHEPGAIIHPYRCFYINNSHPAEVAVAFEVGNVDYLDDRIKVEGLLRELYKVFPFSPLNIDTHRFHARFLSKISIELCKEYEELFFKYELPGEDYYFDAEPDTEFANSLFEKQDLVLWWD